MATLDEETPCWALGPTHRRGNDHRWWGRGKAPVARVQGTGVWSPHATEVADGAWAACQLFGQVRPRGCEATGEAQANLHDPGWAQSPARGEKKPEEVASTAGKGVRRVGAYAQLQVNNSFLGGKIHTGCKGMLAAPHIYTVFCFAVLVSAFLYMPLIVRLSEAIKSMGFGSLAKYTFVLRGVCLLINPSFCDTLCSRELMLETSFRKKNGLRWLWSYGATRGNPLYNGWRQYLFSFEKQREQGLPQTSLTPFRTRCLWTAAGSYSQEA